MKYTPTKKKVGNKNQKKAIKKKPLQVGVKKIVLSSVTTPDFLKGKKNEPPLVQITSKEDGGFLIARIPTDGFLTDTTPLQKSETKWIFKMVPPGGPHFTSKDICTVKGEGIKVFILKKDCGSGKFWLEAFVNKPENKAPTGFFISGYCPAKITKVTWHKYQKDNKGPEIKKGEDVKFGDMLQLHIETEGLNGDVLDVSFLEDQKDGILETVKGVTFGGKLIINFPIKTIWRTEYFNSAERFLSFDLNITVQINHERLQTKFKGSTLTVKNKLSERKLEKGSAVPVNIGKVEIDVKKYELCKYTGITVKGKDREVKLFSQNKLVSKLEPFMVVAGSKKYNSQVTISLDELTTNPKVGCNENGGHDNNTFELDDLLLNYIKDKNNEKLTLNLEYKFPNLDTNKDNLQILKDYTNNLLIPYKFIWPSSEGVIQKSILKIRTCRYSHEIPIHIFPKIKWQLLLQIKLDNPLAYKYANMPPGNITKKHHEIAQKTGYNKWYVGKHENNRICIELGFGAEWDDHQAKLATDFQSKIEVFAKSIQKAYELADKVKKGAGGKMQPTGLPLGLEIMSPAIEASINWQMKEVENDSRAAIEGNLDFKASPLLGAKLIIDLLGAISNLNPAAKIIYTSLNTLVDDISEYVTFTLEFYGQLDIEFNGLKINSVTGMDGGETLISGIMGIALTLKLECKGEIKGFRFSVEYNFKAEAKADAYFGGDFKIDIDNDGLYIEPILKFSGLLVKAEISAKIGKFERSIKLQNAEGKPIEVVGKEEIKFDKKYILSRK